MIPDKLTYEPLYVYVEGGKYMPMREELETEIISRYNEWAEINEKYNKLLKKIDDASDEIKGNIR